MEYVGNLCSPCLLREQPIVIIIVYTRLLICVPYGFIMRRKYFAGHFSACFITNSEYLTKVSKPVL